MACLVSHMPSIPMKDHRMVETSTASWQMALLADRLAGRREHVSLGEVVDGLGRTGICMTLILLTLPALIPVPGPFGLVFGSIVTFISGQLILGARRLWLPELIRNRKLPVSVVNTIVEKSVPVLKRAEALMRPRRLLPLTGRIGRMALGVPLALMAISIALPVPLGNVPPAASLIVLSLGLMLRDGVAVLVGLALAVFSVAWFAVLFLFGAQIWSWLSAFF
jgi:hypothetical protein